MSEQLSALGWHSAAYNYFPSYLNYRNRSIETDVYQLHKLFDHAAQIFDIFHFHNGLTFFSDFRDLPKLRDLGNKIVMHHRGNDVRFARKAARGNGYVNPYVYAGNSLPDATIDRNLKYFASYVDMVLVQDYELYHYVKDYYNRVHVLPRLIEPGRIPLRLPLANKQVPLVVHAPTDRLFKGSDSIMHIVRELQRKYRFEFVLIENMSHDMALRYMYQADIVIDQILCGAYGNVSVEAMAAGKPVIAYIRPDLVSTYPRGLPIASANPDTLKKVLLPLLLDPDHRRQLGLKGRKYVEANHDARKVTLQLISLYRSMMASKS